MFIEAYYTQGAIAHGAIGTNHVDGNTRLCTATAAEALKESFGCDGQPGSYTDVDHADVIALFGHNVAETQTVPFALITGRTVYHFHTRTKTARAQQLQDAAPEVWVEVSQRDASRLGIAECDAVEVSTPRGTITCAARICGIRDGVLFVPFHYGYWDADDRGCSRGHHRADRAANELTPTDWDPVSKQPIYKTGAARLRKSAVSHARRADSPGFAAAPTTTASAPVNGGVPATVGGAAAGVTEVVPAGDRP